MCFITDDICDMCQAVRLALQERLAELTWMSESTKAEAMQKMSRFKVKIGYPVST